MITLEVGNLDGLLAFFLAIMLGPPILLTIGGFAVKKSHPKTAKVLFILGVVYLLIGLGICGGLL
ncbi:hypothetical protein [Flavobacterium hydrophilum]|uniref:Uncharacterized protein n=1 Tax=Flavobacterium hydrophilum TaxID=2211445 RepID=A0A2V4C3V3_9FLAO|nr:hypothetical protein [Flavobacterium hydrophilum]PXY44600.1 hypothetical protein DMB68_14145 [Flavobacterium hydrophilum]